MSCEAAARAQVFDDEGIAGIEEAIPVLLGVFDRPVVLRAADGAIDRDDHPFSKDLVYRLVIEVATVITLDEQGSAMILEEFFQMGGNLLTTGHVAGQRFKLVARGQVTDCVDIFATGGELGVIHGPAQIRTSPLDMMQLIPMYGVVLHSRLDDGFINVPA